MGRAANPAQRSNSAPRFVFGVNGQRHAEQRRARRALDQVELVKGAFSMKGDEAAILCGETQNSSTELSNLVELGLPCPTRPQIETAFIPLESVALMMRYFDNMDRPCCRGLMGRRACVSHGPW